MGSLPAGIMSVSMIFAATPAMAQVPSFGQALYDFATMWGGVGAIFLVGWLIGKQQFPNDRGWQFLVASALSLFAIGMGAMSWWAPNGMPPEEWGGARYVPGVGWGR